MWRRIVVILLTGVAASSLTGCDPAPPSGDPGGVGVSVILNADGGAETHLFLDSHVRSHSELTGLGGQVAPLLFPTASRRTVEVIDNSSGYPFVIIRAAGIYGPGPRPRFTLDARPTVSFLLADSFRSVDVEVQTPDVPATATCGFGLLSRGTGDPAAPQTDSLQPATWLAPPANGLGSATGMGP